MKDRNNKYDALLMDIAIRAAQESNCVKYHVGAVIAKDYRVISMGYNGSVGGFTNCCDRFSGKDMGDKANREEHTRWSSVFEIHAEMNSIAFAAKNGIPTEGTVMYCTHKPCSNCLKHIMVAGIKKVIYLNDYDGESYSEEVQAMIAARGIKVEKYVKE
jgi:dCMP deaminase